MGRNARFVGWLSLLNNNSIKAFMIPLIPLMPEVPLYTSTGVIHNPRWEKFCSSHPATTKSPGGSDGEYPLDVIIPMIFTVAGAAEPCPSVLLRSLG